MENPLVSIVVPVYNVERYIDRCMETIVNQTYENIQIILVDDGSKDSSGIKCDEWSKKDNRIEVVHKKNAGLGFARNSGIIKATGEYIAFIDSDDFVSINMIECLVKNAIQTNSDTVFCSLNRYFSENKIIQIKQQYSNEIFDDKDIINNVLLEMIGTTPEKNEDRYLYASVWHALYSMKIIHNYNILFPSEREMLSEDVIFHIDYLRRAQRVSYIPDCLYYYRENNQSLSQIYNPERVKLWITLYDEINKRLNLFLSKDEYILRTQRMLLGGMRSCAQSIVQANIKGKISLLSEICNNIKVQEVLEEYPYLKNPSRQRIYNSLLRKKRGFVIYMITKIFLLKKILIKE